GAAMTEWSLAKTPLISHEIGTFQHLMQRIDIKNVQTMLEEEKQTALAEAPATTKDYGDTGDSLAKEPIAETISIDDLSKVDLRVARVVKAEHMAEAKKLLKLTVSLGGEDRRTVFAGIKAAYQPEDLEGRMIVVVANLAPRQMKFGTSEAMVLCAGKGGEDLFVLSPDSGAKVGQRLR